VRPDGGRHTRRGVQPFYRFCLAAGWPVLRGLYRFRATGAEHLPSSGFVLASNHESNFDPWPLALAVNPRQLLFMTKAEAFTSVIGPLLRAGGAFPVHRGQRDAAAFETAVRLVRAGGVVMIFPAGTRRTKGKKRAEGAGTGAARIAFRGGVPLVPAAIAGTDSLSRLSRIRVACGPPVATDDLVGLSVSERARIATERLVAAIEGLRAGL
jgi:1-acyl-sn-glycerol-3-phosphate acyltransferase